MLKQNEMLTLDDNKTYTVVFSTVYQEKNYVYLIDQEDYSNTMFCEYDDNNLIEVIDPVLLQNLMKIFSSQQNG